MATFAALYKQLNPEQKKAVDAIDGPVMVIAGPGTGKTQILTLRIANILKRTDAEPGTILALTFTESGVHSMRKRLVEIMGSEGYRVHIYTFHGFCNDIIQQFPDAFPRIIGANNINDIDKIGILKDIILREELTTLKPFGDNFYYIHPLRAKISELKRENIAPLKLAELIKKQEKAYKDIPDLTYTSGAHKGKVKGKYRDLEKKIEKNKELLFIYEEYEKALREKRFYDYDDMILETVRALEQNEDLLLQLQEEFQYVLADEHQDANNAQNRLLELLTSFHKSPNLFIVGDEKQAIFRFQGASLDNFLYFKERYKDALLITLTENYRSVQPILDSAHSLIEKSSVGDKKLRKKLVSQAKGKAGLIEVRAFSKPEFELLYCANDIKKKLDDGVEPSEIAVIYRNNRDADTVVSVFEKTKVPFVVESDQSVFADMDIAKFVVLLKAVHFFGSDASLLPLLHANFLNIDGLDIYKLLRFAQKERTGLYDVLREEKLLKDARTSDPKRLSELYRDLSRWKKVSENQGVLPAVEFIAKDSGFLDYLIEHEESVEKLEKLGGLFRDLSELIENHKDYVFEDMIRYFNDVKEHNILVRKDAKKGVKDAVRLMTAHRSKGLEFEYVYIIGAYDGHFGNQRSVTHFDVHTLGEDSDDTDDERRLFYVALTRAKLGVSVSYPEVGETGRQQLPSRFIEEIDKKLIKEVRTASFEKGVDGTVLLEPGKRVVVPPIHDKTFLNSVFLEQGLSVTALNNYLECPWNYFYSNLLRVPKVPTKHLMFGTVVHNTLKDFFNKMKAGERVNDKTLSKLFHEYVNQYPFTESELKEAVLKGGRAFPGYYKKYKNIWNPNTLNEFRVSVLLPVGLKEHSHLKLRGDLDKMEIGENERDVNVVDYKTGKPKTRNWIEGKTKTSRGDYKRQLVFYKLLLYLHDNGRFEMVSGDIDFIEPDDKGQYHREHFEITDEEVNELKELIQKTAHEILDLSFWDARCDKKDCEYCALRLAMKEQ